MRYQKVYVGVTVEFLSEGGMRPRTVTWTDGEKYQIDRIKFIERAPSKTGGVATKRYTVVISGLERYIYFEKELERWFIERRIL